LVNKEIIKNIVFDFGGVLLDIDYQKTYDAMSTLMSRSFDPKLLSHNVKSILNKYETGYINTEIFIEKMQQLSQKKVPKAETIIDAWNALLIGFEPSKFDLLLNLRKNYKVFLLSNTNELHLNWVYEYLAEKYNIRDFDSRYFDKSYYSHQIGMRKPDEEIFRFVSIDAALGPDDTLFIDDIKENILGATASGWQIYHHNPNDDLEHIIKNKLCLL
jgi:putative hydrolase of the HAD superfamily